VETSCGNTQLDNQMNKTKTVIVGIKTKVLDAIFDGLLKENGIVLVKQPKLRKIK
jgi:hypothetical protein